MKKMTKILALILAVAMLFGLVACDAETETAQASETATGTTAATTGTTTATTETTEAIATETASQYGGTVNIRICAKPVYPDPSKSASLWHYYWTTCVFEPAITRDADNNLAPGVCNYELSEDLLTLKLTVRDGVKFSNGDLVDIYDVEASLQRALNLFKSMNTKVAPYIASMTVEGDTLTINFTEYQENNLYYLASYQTWCAIMPKEICEKYAEDYITSENFADAIGTGPYKITDLVEAEYITVERNENYVAVEEGRTGFAAPKMAYLDEITFYYCEDDDAAVLGLLSGDYDIIEIFPEEYRDAHPEVKENAMPSNTGLCMRFNGVNENNVVSKYPDLRKAIMAAIDYNEFLYTVTDGQAVVSGYPVLSSLYETDVFENADYFGAANVEVAQKYLEAAKAAGYNGETIKLVTVSNRSDVGTLVPAYCKAAGINVETVYMEDSALNDFIAAADSVNNDWDMYFYWATWTFTPTTLSTALIDSYWPNEERDAIFEQMTKLDPTSQEYIDLWQRWAQLWVDDCTIVFMGSSYWYWYTPQEFIVNDEGTARYFFNSYWENPENHMN